MPNTNITLADALGIAEPTETSDRLPALINPKPLVNSTNQIEDDADYARKSIFDIIAQGAAAIELTSNILIESQHPRCAEVLAQLLKTQSDNIDKLLKIQKEKKDLLKPDEDGNTPATGNVNIDKAVFVGTSDELIRMIRKENKVPKVIELDDDE
jgi:Terminase DNA packaging enzyme